MNTEEAQAWLSANIDGYTISSTGPTGHQVSGKIKATGKQIVLNLKTAELALEVHVPMLISAASADSSRK